MSAPTVDVPLSSVVRVLGDYQAQIEEWRAELRERTAEAEERFAAMREVMFDLANMHEEIPESMCGPEAHGTLVAIAETADPDLQHLQDAAEAIAAFDRELATLGEAVTAAHAEFSDLQAEYADARRTDQTAWHTES